MLWELRALLANETEDRTPSVGPVEWGEREPVTESNLEHTEEIADGSARNQVTIRSEKWPGCNRGDYCGTTSRWAFSPCPW
ncbi:hypothetical protein SKAU_G00132650 [Synaphobranchus kaupii]|uniref:Uncharacterized protein n=1 Tax=Synaphobranchus kaupii TaxID=118154 RepID=A0A9Q1FQY1_SYNKA|nr:hypothetical protein SKAU_G00132650 [Synaphobranchus kaupii]